MLNYLHLNASKITAKFLIWILLDSEYGVINQTPKEIYPDCHQAILVTARIWINYLKLDITDPSAADRAFRLTKSAANITRTIADLAADKADAAENEIYSITGRDASYKADAAAEATYAAMHAAEYSPNIQTVLRYAANSAAINEYSPDNIMSNKIYAEFWEATTDTLLKLLTNENIQI